MKSLYFSLIKQRATNYGPYLNHRESQCGETGLPPYHAGKPRILKPVPEPWDVCLGA